MGAGLEGFGMRFRERQEPEIVVVALTTTNALENLPRRSKSLSADSNPRSPDRDRDALHPKLLDAAYSKGK